MQQPSAPPAGPFPGQPGYPPAQAGGQPPFVQPGAPRSPLGPVSATLLGLGGLLAIVSSFLPTYTFTTRLTGGDPALVQRTSASPWNATVGGGGISHSWVQWLGLALVVAGVVAIGGAVLTLTTRNRPAPTPRLLAVAGGATLFGVTVTVITTVLSEMSQAAAESGKGISVTAEPGSTFWLAIIGAVSGIGAVVLTMLSGGRAGSISGTPPAAPQYGYQFAAQAGPYPPQGHPGPSAPPAQPPPAY